MNNEKISLPCRQTNHDFTVALFVIYWNYSYKNFNLVINKSRSNVDP
jgi:hypothetical protein